MADADGNRWLVVLIAVANLWVALVAYAYARMRRSDPELYARFGPLLQLGPDCVTRQLRFAGWILAGHFRESPDRALRTVCWVLRIALPAYVFLFALLEVSF